MNMPMNRVPSLALAALLLAPLAALNAAEPPAAVPPSPKRPGIVIAEDQPKLADEFCRFSSAFGTSGELG